MVGISYRWRNLQREPERAEHYARRSAIASDLYKSGRKIIDLHSGDAPLHKDDGLHNTVADEHLIQAAKEGWDVYPGETAPIGGAGGKEDYRFKLRESICNFLKTHRHVSFSPEHVFVGHGVSGCFTILNNVLLDPGDEVVNIEPSHFFNTEGLGGIPIFQGKLVTVSSDPDNRWEPDLEELRVKISRRTKYIVVDHPTNPTGVVYSDKTLKSIIDIAGENDLPLIVDEMYQLISYDDLKVKSVASLSEDVPTIVLSSTSKFWLLPGWSLGYAGFHDPEGKITELENAVMRHAYYQGFAFSRIPTPIMVAATRMFIDPKAIDFCFKKVKIVEQRRDFTYKRINEIEGISLKFKPQAALYTLLRIDEIGEKNSRWSNDREFVLDLFKEEGVYFHAGSNWGKSAFGHVRTLLYRNIEELTEAFDKLERFMKAKR